MTKRAGANNIFTARPTDTLASCVDNVYITKLREPGCPF
jgi:hypothetical protein